MYIIITNQKVRLSYKNQITFECKEKNYQQTRTSN